MRFRLPTAVAGALLLAAAVYTVRAESKAATVKGYVIDSACTFTKGLKKPISVECAQACAKAGSPLVILADNGSIYWPTTDAMPATSQNDTCCRSPESEWWRAAKSTSVVVPKRCRSKKSRPRSRV